LKLREVPELLFAHLDFGDGVVEHPRPQHGEAASFGIAEHHFRKSLSHNAIPFAERLKYRFLKLAPGALRRTRHGMQPAAGRHIATVLVTFLLGGAV
jgi:hypothetical protein